MSKYGYIGTEPEQTSTSNKGIFQPNDVIELLGLGKYALNTFSLSYLVIAGAGGGVSGNGGGGGAGGYRNSYNSEASGGASSAETILTLDRNQSYTVTVGAGDRKSVV